MKKYLNDKYWQFGICIQFFGNRLYFIDLDGKLYCRNRREMCLIKEVYDVERIDFLFYKLEDDLFMIINECFQYESVKQFIVLEL